MKRTLNNCEMAATSAACRLTLASDAGWTADDMLLYWWLLLPTSPNPFLYSFRLRASLIISGRFEAAVQSDKMTNIVVFWSCQLSAAYAVVWCPSVCLSVCLSGCPSHSCILSKRVNISSKNFHHRVATPFWFLRTECYGNISTATLTGASNAGGVWQNCYFRPVYIVSSRVVNGAIVMCGKQSAAGPWQVGDTRCWRLMCSTRVRRMLR